MCGKCEQFEADTQRYRKLVRTGLDPLTTERIEALIQELKQQKEAVEH